MLLSAKSVMPWESSVLFSGGSGKGASVTGTLSRSSHVASAWFDGLERGDQIHPVSPLTIHCIYLSGKLPYFMLSGN